jgi:TPR repeat protein
MATTLLLDACAQPSETGEKPAAESPTVKQQAQVALAHQNYSTAENLYLPLAQRGDASAQHFLGKMYVNGEGVPANAAEAAKWFRLAADQGHAGAQLYLGSMYADGRGVARDYVQAYKWLALSSQSGQSMAADTYLSEVAKNMTPQQIAEARSLVEAWKAKHTGT